jgi:CRISPR-associated protein Csb2
MSHYLHLSFRLFDPEFHGHGDGGVPEWPPSPLRAFQALVAAAGHRFRNDRMFDAYAREPLTWLEALGLPELIAPIGELSAAYRLYVPNNHEDIVAAARSGGDRFASIAEHRVEKDVRSTRLTGGDTIHYLWPTTPDRAEYVRVLNEIAREVTHLGWGMDQAAASLDFITLSDADSLIGERWKPVANGDTLLRVQQPASSTTRGTLADLRRKHADFVSRLGPNGFRPVPPLTAFRVVGYGRATDPVRRFLWAAYRIVSADPDRPNPSFNTPRCARDVACWVRNAAGRVCKGWPDAATFVHGHDSADDSKPAKGGRADGRLMYLPLPTINHALNRVESVRRVLVAVPADDRDRFNRVRRLLEGQELVWEDRVRGLLVPLPASDWVLRQYVEPARVWSTVTPVVWPGYDDRDPRKVEALLRKALIQAKLPEQVLAGIEELVWRNVGFRAGVEVASRYTLPNKLAGPARHVRVRFKQPVRGPLVIGAGRYRGMGVFASEIR